MPKFPDGSQQSVALGSAEVAAWKAAKSRSQHDGRNVQPADIGNETPDRAQGRFRDLVEKIGHDIDEPVGGIDHVETDQPAHDDREKQDPDI